MRLLLCAVVCALAAPAFSVGTSYWTQTNEAEFNQGTFDNVVATNLGDLKLSRAVKTLMEQDPKISTVSAMVEAPDGAIYAGTGPHGILLKIKDGKATHAAEIEGATHLFALAIDNQARLIVGASGEKGRVLRIDKEGAKPTELFKDDGVQYVWALSVTPDGLIYAATGPTGKLVEIDADGKTRVLLDSDENNLLSLISDGKDLLYVGSDPNGVVYRVNRKTGENFILFDAAESEISALALDKKGNLYAGTAEARDDIPGLGQLPTGADRAGRPEGGASGVPIRAEPPATPEPPSLPDPNPGRPEPIPKQAPQKRSSASPGPADSASHAASLANGFEGLSFAAQKPKAGPAANDDDDVESPDRKDPSDAKPPHPGPPTPPPAPPPGAPAPARPGTLPTDTGRQPNVDTAGTGEPRSEGNAVYRIDPDGFVTEVFRQRSLVLSIVEKDGALLIGSGSEGLIYQVKPAAEETLVVAKVDPKQVMCLLPARDGRVYLGLANVGSVVSMSSGFATEGSYTSPVLDATQISRFGKMQLHGSLPSGTTLKVSTRSGNAKSAGQRGWSEWSKEVPAAEFLQLTSPSARFLQYRLSVTSAEGKTTPVVEDVSIAYQVPNLAPVVKSVRITPVPENAGATANPPGDSDSARTSTARRQAISWEAADPNADGLRYSLYFRRGTDGPWILIKDKISEAQYEWDTRTVADGRYEIKVIASDAASNPPGFGRMGSRVSDPVLVDNTPPVIGDLRWQKKDGAAQISLKVVDRTSVVSNLEYAVDSAKDWQAVLPSDNIFDGPDEEVSFTISGLSPGEHQVTLRATDSKGNQAFENVFVQLEQGTTRPAPK